MLVTFTNEVRLYRVQTPQADWGHDFYFVKEKIFFFTKQTLWV